MTLQGLLLAVSLASAQMTAPIATPSVRQLHDEFIESIDDGTKREVLLKIARTPPVSARDVQALFDLFLRFADTRVREAALASIELMDPHSPSLEPVVTRFLDETEPEAVLFGIKACLRLRAPKALPAIRKIAERQFPVRSVQGSPFLTERNTWLTQYEALAALAKWEGAKTLPLLARRAEEAPLVARIMALYLWKESLPQIVKWANSSSKQNKEKAAEALKAAVPAAAIRETREAMLKILRDRKADRELRHQLALKIGMSSTEGEVGTLLKEHQALSDKETKLMFSAALFASRSRQVIPLLEQHVKEHPEAPIRAGALVQLKDMLPPPEYRSLLEWASRHDPDPDNRQDASEQLKRPLP